MASDVAIALVAGGLAGVDGHHDVLASPAQAPEIGALTLHGWCLVSVVCPPYGMGLSTVSGAPGFLRAVTGRLLRQWDNLQTLLDRVKQGPASNPRACSDDDVGPVSGTA